ncbi:MAG TPA: acyloxyacyl hydrolase [Gemmatimonadaceae bacterium]|nr:acyloxyacyl hydrolase [Gemmatimonadaceae bacterium]
MRRRLLTTLLFLHAPLLGAQSGRLSPGDRFVGASAAASFYTQSGAHFANIRDRNVFGTGLTAEWVLEAAGPLAVATTIEVVPLAVVSRRAGPLEDCWTSASGRRRCQLGESSPAVGSGILPFGLKLYFANTPRVRAFTSGATGMMLFSQEMPVTGSRRMNFAVEYGAGAEISTIRGSSVVVGWKFQHMSNAYTAPLNPGVDANMLYLGLLHRRR